MNWILPEDSTERFSNFNRTWSLSDTTKRYRKELIKNGKYQKGDMKFEVTEEILNHWAKTGKEMMDNGVKCPLILSGPENRHNVNDPDCGRGWVKGYTVENGSLFAEIEINAENPDLLAKNYDCSINVPPSFLDGKGHRYERPITHVALTEHPVIPGLAEFKTISASMFVEEIKLSENSVEENTEVVDNKIMDYTAIAKELELGDTADEAAIISAIKELKGKVIIPVAPAVETIAASLPAEPDARLVKMTADNFTMKLSQLVKECKINPAVASKITKRYLESDTLSLSIKNNNENVIGDILDILADNQVLSLSEKTGPQSITALSDIRSGDQSAAILMKVAANKPIEN